MLRFLARCFALLCAVLFVPATLVVLFFHASGTQLTQAQAYKETLDRVNFYSKAPALVASTIVDTLQRSIPQVSPQEADQEPGVNNTEETKKEEGLALMIQDMHAQDWPPLLNAALPAGILRTQTEGLLDQLFTYLAGPEGRPTLELSFVEMKARLKGPELEDAYVKLLQSKPAYTADMPYQEIPFSYCPTEESLAEVRERFSSLTGTLADQVPDNRDLVEIMLAGDNSGNVLKGFDYLRKKTQLYQVIAKWSPALPVLLLLLILAFGVRSMKGFLLWWGIPLLLAGALTALCSLPSMEMAQNLIMTLLKPQLPPEMPTEAINLVLSLFTTTMDVVFANVFKHATWVAGAGFIAFMLSFLFKFPKPAVKAI